MSSTLTWNTPPKTSSLPYELKHALEKRYQMPFDFTYLDLPYLRGLADCGINGAKELIELIEEYGTVELQLEY